MSAWFNSTDVSVKSGETVVIINDSAPANTFEMSGGALKIGSFEFIETAGLAIEQGTNKTVILLAQAWPHSTQTGAAADGFNTAASHTQSARLLREVSEDFTAELSIREKLYSSTAETVSLTMPSGTTYTLRPWKKLEADVSTAVAAIPTEIESNWQSKLQSIRLSTLMNPLVRLPLKNSLKGDYAGDLTFKRASTATYIDRKGIVKTAAIDGPRFEAAGYLNETSGTNLLPFSGGLDSTKASGVALTTSQAPDLSELAVRMIGDVGYSRPRIFSKEVSFEKYKSYSISVFVRAKGCERIQLQVKNGAYLFSFFDVKAGAVIDVSPGCSAAILNQCHLDFYRVSMTFRATESDVRWVNVFLVSTDGSPYVGDGINGVDVFGLQVENALAATSYIPTQGTPVTRAADALTLAQSENYPLNERTVAFKSSSASNEGSVINASGTTLTLGAANDHLSELAIYDTDLNAEEVKFLQGE